MAGTDLVVAYPDEPAGAVADRMVRHEIGRLPVISRDDDRLVGLVARKDLLQVRQRLAVEERVRDRSWGRQSAAIRTPA